MAEDKRKRESHVWTDEETHAFLALMAGDNDDVGYFDRIKRKKMPRSKAMLEISEVMRGRGFLVTASNCDNKWKALLHSYRVVEDHNAQSGNATLKEGPWHDEVALIMCDRASTRPKSLVGSGLPLPRVPSSSRTPPPSSADMGSSRGSSVERSTPGPSSSSSEESSLTLDPLTKVRKRLRPEFEDDDEEGEELNAALIRRSPSLSEECGRSSCQDSSTSGTGEAQQPHPRGLSPQSAAAKKVKVRASRARSSEILEWANKYSDEQKAIEERKLQLAKEHHADRIRQQEAKMGLLERLVSVLEKRAS